VRPLAEFNPDRDQVGWFRKGEEFTGPVGTGYVHDFLFVKSGIDVQRLLASSAGT
jgi:hypothetical protein